MMTNQPDSNSLPPFDGVEDAQMALVTEKLPGKVSQFRLYGDANSLIPIAKTSKTAFVHEAVRQAANEPSRIGWALVHRAGRTPQGSGQQNRISISTSVAFQENVEALSVLLRLPNEEIVRLAVEASVFMPLATKQRELEPA